MVFNNVGEYRNYLYGTINGFFKEKLDYIVKNSITEFQAFPLLFLASRSIANSIPYEELDLVKPMINAIAISYSSKTGQETKFSDVIKDIIRWETEYRDNLAVTYADWYFAIKTIREASIIDQTLLETIEGFVEYTTAKGIDITYEENV